MICETGLEWKQRVCASGCGVHEDRSLCSGPLQAHHVITQAQLKKHGLWEHRWSTDIGMPICDRAHDRHHSAHERIAYELIPNSAIRFAFEHEVDYILDRYYPKLGGAGDGERIS